MAYEGPLMCKVSVESVRSPENASPAAARSRVFAIFADMLAAKGRKFLVEIGSQRRHRSSPPAHRTKTPKSRAELDPSVPGNCRFSGQVQVLSFENH